MKNQTTNFNFCINCSTNKDPNGRIIERRMFNSSSIIKIGDKYAPGIYVAELRQGERSVLVKLVKGGQ
jgi:hypothetical protein